MSKATTLSLWNGVQTILWQEYLLFERRFWRNMASTMVTPLLYLIAFGFGLGRGIRFEGTSYLEFVIPGIVALTTMNGSFNAVATPVNIARMYDKTFEEYLTAPISMLAITSGRILAGALRGLFSGTMMLVLTLLFGVHLKITPLFFLMLFLNCLLFAGFGFWAALTIQSHSDVTKFNSFVINPMSFLCGTFFSLQSIPGPLALFLKILPLTHTTTGLRAIASGQGVPWWNLTALAFFASLFFLLSLRACYQVED
ncbi:ABC transporter permease [Heliophilum fasciatum]|uniref:Transport permease protein n=1 Tax=Heliophilum fasciatum TaxID=35700 RepID=A0A4V2SY04_9FIRM|nr:ABC transporter permease [Heliophilum fasciatum]MCW2277189.1 ABC-type multidrug transport system permease subunit [Heliophilum fasciatum]TCP68176.1 ABC-type polysaccharide/polyol phosphate export permease [Heliophilum fasciatum]